MNILLATDGGPHSEKVSEYAVDYASRFNAGLFVMYAICPSANKEEAFITGKTATQAIKMKALEKRVSVTTMIEAGDPAETVIRTADKIGAETIIMGASGSCAVNRKRPLGSVSSIVAQDACCSVIIVR